jgi:hypothetical protein
MSQPAMKTIGGKDEDWALAGTDAFVAISVLMITGRMSVRVEAAAGFGKQRIFFDSKRTHV